MAEEYTTAGMNFNRPVTDGNLVFWLTRAAARTVTETRGF